MFGQPLRASSHCCVCRCGVARLRNYLSLPILPLPFPFSVTDVRGLVQLITLFHYFVFVAAADRDSADDAGVKQPQDYKCALSEDYECALKYIQLEYRDR